MKKIAIAFCILVFNLSNAQNTNSNDDDYIVQDSVLIKTQSGAWISAIVVRNKVDEKPLPVILQFTIYPRKTDVNKAKLVVDNGYVGVIAYTRGKKNSPDELIPYEYDGDDAYAVIDWISKQEWCNGSVGMYGGSYSGFTQWAATKSYTLH